MNHTAPSADKPPTARLSRRTALKTGAVGGALLWTVPAMQIVNMSVAEAASGVTPPPPPPPPPPPKPTGTLPSHGFMLVNCGSGWFAVKIDSGNTGTISGIGNQDKDYLASQGLAYGSAYRNPTSADLAHLTSYGESSYNGQVAMFITVPAGCQFKNAYTFDGSFAGGGVNCGNGDKFTNAFVSGSTVFFSTLCND